MVKYLLLATAFHVAWITPVTSSLPVKPKAEPVNFLMPVEDVFNISGRGTVVTGIIQRGTIKAGDQVELVGINDEVITARVNGLEMFRKMVVEAKEGQNVGVILSGVEKDKVKSGMVLAKPGTIAASKKFTCELSLKSPGAGGRTTPLANTDRIHIFFYRVGFSGKIILPKTKENITPGETTTLTVELETPVAMEKGTTFSIKEAGKEIGSGNVLRPGKK